ncbi:MAG: single-stranded DNA-binding protein [Aggregatilineales bacterium]
MSYQQLIAVGYIGADAEIRYLAEGTAVTNFSIAVNKRVKNAQGEKTQKTTWFNIALWGERGETLVSYLKKGTLVLVTGEVMAEAYSDKKTGNPLASLKLTADRVQLLSPKPEEEPPNDQSDEDTVE